LSRQGGCIPDNERQQNNYLPGYGSEMHAIMARRSASREAGFLLPYLQPGMRVLDCGSGPGTITLGLAEAVAPGEVVGIDLSPIQVERGRALAVERGIDNARFEVGDIRHLPFADGTFDVAWASAVLMHLRDPVAALREMRRVVRPGGLLAVRDHGYRLAEPRTPAVERYFALQSQIESATVGRPGQCLGLQHRRLLLDAGCTRTEGFADVVIYGDPQRLREHATFVRSLLDGGEYRAGAIKLGWDEAALNQLANDMVAWYARPDTVMVVVWSAGLGWVDV
jgi:SAM-dependent methyltransferase